MKKQYNVFSAHMKTAAVVAKLPDGTEVQATVPVLEAQLVPVEPLDGTISISFKGTAQIEEANSLFVEGMAVDVEFSITAVAPAATTTAEA